MNISEEKELDQFRHKLKIKEIILDKLIFAGALSLLFVFLTLYGNMMLRRYENSLDTKLEQLREVYQFERILAQSEIEAHEQIWIQVTKFRKLINTYLSERFTALVSEKIKAENLILLRVIEENEIYISEDMQIAIYDLAEIGINNFLASWASDEDARMSMETWQILAEETDKVRDRIRVDIYAKKPNN